MSFWQIAAIFGACLYPVVGAKFAYWLFFTVPDRMRQREMWGRPGISMRARKGRLEVFEVRDPRRSDRRG